MQPAAVTPLGSYRILLPQLEAIANATRNVQIFWLKHAMEITTFSIDHCRVKRLKACVMVDLYHF